MSEKQKALRSPWVLAWIGMFVIFVGANFVMIYLAESRSPGLVVEDYYDRGQDYEANMLKRQAKALAWDMQLIAPPYVDVAKATTYGVRISDRAGAPFAPDSVVFYAYRPADAEQDFSVPMKQIELGLYQAPVSFPLLGVWDILISARSGEGEINLPHRISAGVK
ncbi:MAG: FixH family protein [Candidatus Sedimenticola endophacoides]